MKPIFGILAAFIGVAAAIPYVRAILNNKTRPHRVSWLIWSLLSSLAVITQLQTGAKWSVLLATASLFNNVLIFILSIRYGTGGTTIKDRMAFVVALIGCLIWLLTDNALFGLLGVIAGDAIGTLLTVEKAYKAPHSENLTTWYMAVIASVFGFMAINNYLFAQIIQPAYSVIGGSLIVTAVHLGRKRIINQ